MIINEHVLYGLENYGEIISEIISNIDSKEDHFDIRLMLTEALSNAFKHGNKNSLDKPIYLNNGKRIIFEIEDSGAGIDEFVIPEEIHEDKVLGENGRGLFIIKSIADSIEFKNSTLIIEKSFNDK